MVTGVCPAQASPADQTATPPGIAPHLDGTATDHCRSTKLSVTSVQMTTSRWVLTLATALASLGAGCATTTSNMDLVRQRAVFDLGCNSQINVVELGNGDTFGATGCGNKASYIVKCESNYASSCTAIMNSDGKPAK